jgi:hypothetical protein
VSFDGTLHNSIIYIQVPPFWRANGFRRAVFTLLLRCAGVYYKNNVSIEQAVRGYELGRMFLPVLNHFFKGNTVINPKLGLNTNTVYYFRDKNEEYIKQNLTKEVNP